MVRREKLIAPSILSADFANLEREIKAIARAGADWVHVDVMDGHFVNNITIGVPVVASLKKISPLPLDVHLMIENPEKYIEQFIKAGADYLTVHVEASQDIGSLLRKIKGLGAKAGLTMRPGTPVEVILPFLSLTDLVLVMTVEPGFGGQKFMQDQLSKVKIIRENLDSLGSKALIEVDGGVNAETAKLCTDVDVLVAGNYIFKNEYEEAIQALKGNS